MKFAKIYSDLSLAFLFFCDFGQCLKLSDQPYELFESKKFITKNVKALYENVRSLFPTILFCQFHLDASSEVKKRFHKKTFFDK